MLHEQQWGRLAEELGVDRDAPASLRAPEVHTAVLGRMEPLLQAFPAYAQVRAVHLSLEPWTIENGLATPTQKLRRPLIMERYAEAIDALYAGHALPATRQA